MSQHVIQRGNNRCNIFGDAADYLMFLDTLRRACFRHGVEVHGYTLMTNHVHFVVTPQSAVSLPRVMQALGRRYVYFFNHRYHRSGGLWEGRYRAWPIEDEQQWLTCLRYIELNPVRAGLVSVPEAYRWSSYCAHAHGLTDDLVTPHPCFLALAATDEARKLIWQTHCGVASTS